jgi:hypothetical protein
VLAAGWVGRGVVTVYGLAGIVGESAKVVGDVRTGLCGGVPSDPGVVVNETVLSPDLAVPDDGLLRVET